jgi:putative component of toxin-antitoxin plasmid stabilization module
MKPQSPYLLQLWTEDDGRQPCVEWFENDLSVHQRAAILAALKNILAYFGKDVCETEYGKALGEGLFEFRLRWGEDEVLRKIDANHEASSSKKHEGILLRVYFYPYGEKIVLLIGGYDKGDDPSGKREQKEIKGARKALTRFLERQRRVGVNPKKVQQRDIPKDQRFN